jgi:micrococcal nuclease
VRVVDGDTLVVDRGRGEEKLRLIGIDCPESVNSDKSKNTEEGRVASNFTKSVVSVGQAVWLQKDTSDTDRYGRLLRYVWLEKPTLDKDPEEVATKMLNGLLVKQGHAEPKRYAPDTAYAEVFESIKRYTF